VNTSGSNSSENGFIMIQKWFIQVQSMNPCNWKKQNYSVFPLEVQCNSKEKVPTLICYWLMTRNLFTEAKIENGKTHGVMRFRTSCCSICLGR
jgi:hypothetical protein